MAEQWLSIVEYARAFQISDMTVRRRIKTGRLNAVLKSGKYYIPVRGSDFDSARGNTVVSARPQEAARKAPPREAVVHPQRSLSTFEMEPTQPALQPDRESEVPQEVAETSPTQREWSRSPSREPIPRRIERSVSQHRQVVADTAQFLDFCADALARSRDAERAATRDLRNEAKALRMEMQAKDLEIATLRQKVEDLQLLVRMLETKQT